MSNIFLSEIECRKDGNKKNSFKGILLNKCLDEFNKKNLYNDWNVEKKEFDGKKTTFTESERLEKEEELEFRRMKIKKQVLGNIRFIGELFKIGMLRVKVMRDCIESLDEEDHEAVCKLFNTIGSTIDTAKVEAYIDIYFSKITHFSEDMSLNARSRFLYQDLIDLRRNRWKARRQEETAKTLDEIKKDFEREERKKERESQMANNYGGYRGNRDNRDSRRGGQNRGDNRRGDDYRNDGRDDRDNRRGYPSGNRNRSTKDRVEPKIDKDGFTEVAKGAGTNFKYGSTPKILSRDSKSGTSRDNKSARSGDRQSQQQHQKKPPIAEPAPPPKPVAEPMNEDKLKLRAKNMRNEYMQENNQEELILSMDDLKASPNAGHVIVQASLDTAIDCKEADREAIVAILSIRTGIIN